MLKTKKIKIDMGPPVSDVAATELHEKKLLQRRTRWSWNVPLIVTSGVLACLVLVGSLISYVYHSGKTAETFLEKAEFESSNGRFDEQVIWLDRYSMLKPNDVEGIVNTAMAAERATDIDQAAHSISILEAHNYLSNAIGRLGEEHVEERDMLRRRLIERQLQLGTYRANYFLAAKQQVVTLDAKPEDPESLRILALAIAGQVINGIYNERIEEPDQNADFWEALANQKPGAIMFKALDANPTDIDLLDRLVDLAVRPDVFELEVGTEKARLDQLKSLIEQRLLVVQENLDSRTQLVKYRFAMMPFGASEEESNARKIEAVDALKPFAKQAEERLSLGAESSDPDTVEQQKTASSDFNLLTTVAMGISDENPELAQQYFEVLRKNRPEYVRISLFETVFLLSGNLAFTHNSPDMALKIWEQGLEEINPDSVRILLAIATLQVELQSKVAGPESSTNDSESRQAVERFRKAIEVAVVNLSISKSSLGDAARIDAGLEIEIARWRMNRLDARLKALSGKTQEAIELLELTLAAPGRIDVAERVSVAIDLAGLHRQLEAWDLAAMAVDQAIALDPGNLPMLIQSAIDWSYAGNDVLAQKQLRIAGMRPKDALARASVDLLMVRIASLELEYKILLRQPTVNRDFSKLRFSIGDLFQDLTLVDQTGSLDETELQKRLEESVRRLETISASLPPVETTAEEYLNSAEFEQKVSRLAEEYPDDSQIQLFAAEQFATLGNQNASNQALERLETILGSDSVAVAVTRANVESIRGDDRKACLGLVEFAAKNPAESESLMQHAANYALQINDSELAYQSLLSVPEENRTAFNLFSLARISGFLPDGSKYLDGVSRQELSDQWQARIRDVEGESSSNWLYLESSKLLVQLSNESNPDKDCVAKASQLIGKLLSKRPRWGMAISLKGGLLAIEGKTEQAVIQLRAGIAAGDFTPNTRKNLKNQLILLDRDDEAEEEILRGELLGQPIDKYSSTRIHLAQRSGDFSRSLELSRRAVEEQPNDFLAHCVHIRTVLVAAEQAKTDDERKQRMEEVEHAIQTAEKLENADPRNIQSYWLGLRLLSGDAESVRRQIDIIGKVKMDEFDRLILMSKGFVGIKDYKSAIPLLLQADKLKPSFQTQLDIASVYKQLNQPDLEITALRDAQHRAPANPALRNRLAQALVTRDTKEIDWEELRTLLQSESQAQGINRFAYVALLANRGNEEQVKQAEEMLRNLVKEQNSFSNDAARILAVVLRNRITDKDKPATGSLVEQDELLIAEIKSLYDSLIRTGVSNATDLYRYADFLLDHGRDEMDLNRVGRLSKDLQSGKNGTLAALDIGIRYAKKTGSNNSPELVKEWGDGEIENGLLDKNAVATITFRTLRSLGSVDEGIDWLERAYGADHELLGSYVVALNDSGQAASALDVCLKHYQKYSDIQSVLLLSETMQNASPLQVKNAHSEIIDQAVKENTKNAPLLESIATLRVHEQDYAKAVSLFHLIDQLDGNRLKTLNNLAMAYSELPGQEAKGLEPIKRAIQLAETNRLDNVIPELLDTYGVLLLRTENPVEAERVFRRAILRSKDPRFEFHLILALEMQNKLEEANRLWNSLDLENLNPAGQTISDREKLESMKLEKEKQQTEVISEPAK